MILTGIRAEIRLKGLKFRKEIAINHRNFKELHEVELVIDDEDFSVQAVS